MKSAGRLARLAPLRAPQWAAANLKAWWIGYYDWGRSAPD